MPRDYNLNTPAGDPSNPLTLISTGIDVPTVQFTPQDQVATPVNQFEKLNQILNLGTRAATLAINARTDAIENQISITAAKEKAYERSQALNELNQKERQRQIKEWQESNLNSFDSKITAALLKDDYKEADRLATQFSNLYPVEDNPYMAGKAQDQRLRVRNAERAWRANLDNDLAKLSQAAQGSVLSDVVKIVDGANARFDNEETQTEFLSGFKDVPDDKLPDAMVDAVYALIPMEKKMLLNPLDKSQITTAILEKSGRLADKIRGERNKQRTYQRYVQYGDGVLATVVKMEDPEKDLPEVFSYFDRIEEDRINGKLSNSQAAKLETLIVNGLAENAATENPVSGAVAIRGSILDAMNRGDIPWNRGSRVVKLLEERAKEELTAKINGFIADARAEVGPDDADRSLAILHDQDPGLEMGFKLGVYEYNGDGTIRIAEGYEGLAGKLQNLSTAWMRQREELTKYTAFAEGIDFVANASFVQNEYETILGTQTPNVNVGKQVDDILFREINSAYSYTRQPEKMEAHMLTSYNLVQQEIERDKSVQITPEQQKQLDDLKAIADRNPLEAEAEIRDMFNSYMEKDPATTTPEERTTMYRAMGQMMDRTLTGRQKAAARRPEEMIGDLDPSEMVGMAESAAARLYNDREKISQVERNIREQQVARMIAASDTNPRDFLRYVDETYFRAGASESQLAAGANLLMAARQRPVDSDGYVLNLPSVGSVERELALYAISPVMYDTLAMAEGFALTRLRDTATGQVMINVDSFPSHLAEAHRVALRTDSLRKQRQNQIPGQNELLPAPQLDPISRKPMYDVSTLTGFRTEQLRTLVKDVFGRDVPVSADRDILASVDPEDYNRINALTQGFIARGYSREQAVTAALSKLKYFGYTPVVGDPTTGPVISFIYDPFNHIPSNDEIKFGDFQQFIIEQVINPNIGQVPGLEGTLNPFAGGNTANFNFNMADLSRPDSRIGIRIMRSNGDEIYIPESKGFNRKEFKDWQRKQQIKNRNRPGLEG